MTKLLYTLEDHFDAIAEQQRGYVSGWLSAGLRGLFGLAGDVLRASVDLRRV